MSFSNDLTEYSVLTFKTVDAYTTVNVYILIHPQVDMDEQLNLIAKMLRPKEQGLKLVKKDKISYLDMPQGIRCGLNAGRGKVQVKLINVSGDISSVKIHPLGK